MQILSDVQGLIVLGLSLLALGAEVFALAHAVRQRQDAFPAAGKQTKTFWVAALVIATLMGIAAVGGVGLLGIIAIVLAGVYLADVRPAIDEVLGRRR
ncbi:DUF2516 family protein [Janibacter anophelis]|uniref:DUF2516 family protein n=1 Tax=Janibacter anophelis TaxID=319054 RepID=UPI00082CC533|nr:DUF2516 family protein [Janibacter anophelis]